MSSRGVERSTGVNWRTGTVVAALLLVLLAACSTDDTYLPALLEDPIAHLESESADLVRRTERPESHRGFFGGSPALVQQVVEIREGIEPDQAVLEAVAAARAAEWVFDENRYPTSFGLWKGTKTLEIGEAAVDISIAESTGQLGVELVYEVLFHEGLGDTTDRSTSSGPVAPWDGEVT